MSPTQNWFPFRANAPPSPRCRLFCFHHAGGNAFAFRDWRFPGVSLEVLSAELPGRGRRIMEPPVASVREAVAALATTIREQYGDLPFGFFGYSLGTVIAFECARALRASGGPMPRYLAVGAASAPPLRSERRKLADLPHDQFIEELKLFEGTPKELFDEPELLELVLPILRADFRISDGYEYVGGEPPLDLTLRSFAGTDDHDALPERVAAWKAEVTRPLSPLVLRGGHFFLQTSGAQVREVVVRDLAALGLL